MKLSVEFKAFSREENQRAVQIEEAPIGLAIVDSVRQELEFPKLSLEVFQYYTKRLSTNPEVYIDEETARESNKFKDNFVFYVRCDVGALNRFAERVIDVEKTDNGNIQQVIIRYEFNEASREKLLKFWVEQGFPYEIKGDAE